MDTPDQLDADFTMKQILNDTYTNVKLLLQRNTQALDVIIDRLCTPATPLPGEEPYSGNSLTGPELNEIVAAYAHRADVARRDAEKAVFM